MIDREKVLHVAKLARLKLSDDEIENYTRQLGSILNYIDELNTLDTTSVEPTCLIVPQHDPLRDDQERPSLEKEEILKNGPNVKRGHFAIPKVIS